MTKPRLLPHDRVLPGDPPELIVYDRLQPCPYLPERIARMPLRIPARLLQRAELEQRLDTGDRRQGIFLYRTSCPGCRACEPIRIEVEQFSPNRSQRRALDARQRADHRSKSPIRSPTRAASSCTTATKSCAAWPAIATASISKATASSWSSAAARRFELRYLLDGQLIGVALVDRSDEALSAVYCYYDPSYEKLGIGTFSVLKQIELCKTWGLRYLYLGLYIAESERMRYKARFLPHQRRIDGNWQTFEREP